MARLKVPYVHCYTDVRGKERCYFNRKGWPKISLPLPNEDGFMEAYLKAKNTSKPTGNMSNDRIKSRSIAALIRSYRRSDLYTTLKQPTQYTYDRFLNNLENSFGKLPAKSITPQKINKIRNKLKYSPVQANRLLSILRILFGHAMNEGWLKEDPTIHIKKLRAPKSAGFPTWPEEAIEQFIVRWPLGTKEHLALQLLLQTSQRRKDIVDFSFEMITEGVITVKQSKTGVVLTIPILPDLSKALGLLEHRTGPILRTDDGNKFTAEGFGNFFREAVYAANLPGLSAHGLRKAMCVRLAEAGCSPHEIQAISGHLTLSEVSRYTEQANKKKMAKDATNRLLKK